MIIPISMFDYDCMCHHGIPLIVKFFAVLSLYCVGGFATVFNMTTTKEWERWNPNKKYYKSITKFVCFLFWPIAFFLLANKEIKLMLLKN